MYTTQEVTNIICTHAFSSIISGFLTFFSFQMTLINTISDEYSFYQVVLALIALVIDTVVLYPLLCYLKYHMNQMIEKNSVFGCCNLESYKECVMGLFIWDILCKSAYIASISCYLSDHDSYYTRNTFKYVIIAISSMHFVIHLLLLISIWIIRMRITDSEKVLLSRFLDLV